MIFFGSIALVISRGATGVAFELGGGLDGGVVRGEGGVGINAGSGVVTGTCWMLRGFLSALISAFSPSFSTL
jgi:hypothetical protein